MRKLLNPFSMLVCGLVIGTAARLMDIYCDNLGEIFSQMSVWMLLGTLIAIYSPTKKAAALNILPFCLGMLLTYYAVAMISHGVYGRSFIIGWTVFALCTPVLAWFAWMAKQPGALGKLISVGVVNGLERFDACTVPHAHFICTHCGAVIDVDTVDPPEHLIAQVECGAVRECTLTFSGICNSCIRTDAENNHE